MEAYNLYTIDIYKFYCNDILTDRILEILKKENFSNNVSNQGTMTDLFFDKELFEWFDCCIKEVKEKIGLPKTVNLPITSCWANKSKKLMSHHQHSHPNSIVSGIFYLTSNDQDGPTVFYLENYWTQKLRKDFRINNLYMNTFSTKHFPEKSTLILFPSHLEHSVSTVKTNNDRYTISFNTYLDGSINDGKDKSRLQIKTKSVRDFYENTEQT